jgi:hypothetical protein
VDDVHPPILEAPRGGRQRAEREGVR